MRNATKWIGMATLAGLMVLAGAAPPAEAAGRVVPGPIFGGTNTPLRSLVSGPGLVLAQNAYDRAALAMAYSYIPSYLQGGYSGMPYGGSTYVIPSGGSGYSPAPSNPYSSLYTNGGLPATGSGDGSSVSSSSGLPATVDQALGAMSYATPEGGSYGDPYGGRLRGQADLINASARAALPVEGARLMHEQVKQQRIENRRRLFDEIMYERANTPTYVERQEKQQAQEVRYSQNLAQAADVNSARALNILLRDAKQLLAKGIVGPAVELDLEVVQQINLRGESGRGNVGLLKSKRPLNWPPAFDDLKEAEQSTSIRGTIDAKFMAAVDQAPTGRVNTGIINDLKSNLAELHRLLARNVNRLGSNEYIRAKRFLNELDDGVTALQDPNVANQFNQNFRGKTVKELVEFMVKRGLQFAPATLGDENAYQALYQALAAYDIGAHQKTGVATAKE